MLDYRTSGALYSKERLSFAFHGRKAPKSAPSASIFALNRWTDLAFHRRTGVRPRCSFTAVGRQHAALCRHFRSKTDPPCRACQSRPRPRGSRPDDSQFVGRNGSIISGFEPNSWNYAAVGTRADPAPAARSPETENPV